MKIIAACTLLTLGGCALVPNSVRPEFEHISHATQHEPFTNHPTEYGANMANLVLHWDLPKHFSLELAEGIDLDKAYAVYGQPEHGEIMGPREQFSGRISYSIQVKP